MQFFTDQKGYLQSFGLCIVKNHHFLLPRELWPLRDPQHVSCKRHISPLSFLQVCCCSFSEVSKQSLLLRTVHSLMAKPHAWDKRLTRNTSMVFIWDALSFLQRSCNSISLSKCFWVAANTSFWTLSRTLLTSCFNCNFSSSVCIATPTMWLCEQQQCFKFQAVQQYRIMMLMLEKNISMVSCTNIVQQLTLNLWSLKCFKGLQTCFLHIFLSSSNSCPSGINPGKQPCISCHVLQMFATIPQVLQPFTN